LDKQNVEGLSFTDLEFEIATGLRCLDAQIERIQKKADDPELQGELDAVRSSIARLRDYVRHAGDQISLCLVEGWREMIPDVTQVHVFGAKAKEETPNPEKLNASTMPDPFDVETLI